MPRARLHPPTERRAQHLALPYPTRRPPAVRPGAAALVAVLALAALVACTSARPRPKPVDSGLASWYGGQFHGRKTASGERFDKNQLTAAHRSLPFGTVVEVRNLDNDRRVRVRVNDRGPFVRRRVIDLSFAAAKELGMIGPGTARVELLLVESAPEVGGRYTVQLGAFLEPERAEALYQRLTVSHPDAQVRSDGTWHRVQVGEFDRRRAAERTRRELAGSGYAALVVALRQPQS
jgi:rare lipoprotein A